MPPSAAGGAHRCLRVTQVTGLPRRDLGPLLLWPPRSPGPWGCRTVWGPGARGLTLTCLCVCPSPPEPRWAPFKSQLLHVTVWPEARPCHLRGLRPWLFGAVCLRPLWPPHGRLTGRVHRTCLLPWPPRPCTPVPPASRWTPIHPSGPSPDAPPPCSPALRADWSAQAPPLPRSRFQEPRAYSPYLCSIVRGPRPQSV